MAQQIKDPKLLRLKFGGGLHSRASEEDIDPRECADGENFALDADNQQLRNRKPFDLIATAPNGSSIMGGATLLKSDGTVSTLVQAGDSIYEWDGATTFTYIAAANASSKLRGRIEHNWQLSDKVIITDVALVDSVKEWDGTTLQDVTFTDEEGYGFGTFRARYGYVSNERLVFANVHSNGTDTPHLIVGSTRSDYTQITIVNRPVSSANASDPFFIVQPDNQYINGIVSAFGTTVFSSKLGALHQLSGSDATDFAISELAPKAGSSSDEGLQTVINDIVIGSQGRIKSVSATDKYGNVEASDLSFWIADELENYSDWLIATNDRLRRTYFHPVGASRIYVLYHDLIGSGISPWSKWTTDHTMSFNPTFMMNMYDPSDGLEYVFMGDSSGNFYRMEGTGTAGDGGTTAISSYRTSKLFSADTEGKLFNIEGWCRYRRGSAVTATIDFIYAGEHRMTESVSIAATASSYNPVYGTTAYYGTQYFYGTDEGFIVQQRFAMPGGSNEFQVKVSVSDADDYTINEIGLRFDENN